MLYNNTFNPALNISGACQNKPILILTKLPKISAVMSNETTQSEGKVFSAKIVQNNGQEFYRLNASDSYKPVQIVPAITTIYQTPTEQIVTQSGSDFGASDFSQKQPEAKENIQLEVAELTDSEKNHDKIELKATKGFENIPNEWYSFFRVFNENTNRFSTSFECKFEGCSKVFTKKQNILEHFRMHQNERKYRCQLCNRSFVLKGNLKKHFVKLHDPKMQNTHLLDEKSEKMKDESTHRFRETIEAEPYKRQCILSIEL